ncbi:MAG: pyridoxine 5'-phosphate synthase [Thermodesulfobacteriota bacterium]
MPRLNVNIDHVATVRQSRRGAEPDPVLVAYLVELAGAEGVVVHLREDRRHIQDRDVRILKQTVKTKLNMEMAPTEDMVAIAIDIRPDMVTLVPEKREEITTEGGLNILADPETIVGVVNIIKKKGLFVSIFIDPDWEQIKAAKNTGADMVEIHTGSYAEAKNVGEKMEELKKIENSVGVSQKLGLRVSAGHGLNYINVTRISQIRGIEELNIGHSIISRSVIVGIEKAVKEMLELRK